MFRRVKFLGPGVPRVSPELRPELPVGNEHRERGAENLPVRAGPYAPWTWGSAQGHHGGW